MVTRRSMAEAKGGPKRKADRARARAELEAVEKPARDWQAIAAAVAPAGPLRQALLDELLALAESEKVLRAAEHAGSATASRTLNELRRARHKLIGLGNVRPLEPTNDDAVDLVDWVPAVSEQAEPYSFDDDPTPDDADVPGVSFLTATAREPGT
jgi:hypothetical protein